MIIPIFIMSRGCPRRCLYCNEALTAEHRPERLEEEGFRKTVLEALDRHRGRGGPRQIAFYGGTFTGMPRQEQRRLLGLAAPFLHEGVVDGVRISTRPDEIDGAGLDLVRGLGVTTVEVGAQSLDDHVLRLSRRGHTAADTHRAFALLKERGFQTGIHLMAGLPGDSPERFSETIDRVIALSPDTVRIHPTIVLQDTPLAEAYGSGDYRPLSLPEAISQCKEALKRLTAAGIDVIRMGIQTTPALEAPGAVVAGPFHPAFRSLVESAIFFDMAAVLCESAGRGGKGKSLAFRVSPADLSPFKGPRKANIDALTRRFAPARIEVAADPSCPRRTLVLTAAHRSAKTDWSGGIEEVPGQKIPAHRGRMIS
ncbi:MAG: radical SAM protein [Thermodesulfobacteriota bacterium]